MSAYLAIRYVHIVCVVLSLAGFALRGVLALAGSPAMQARLARIAPHVVDTLLLASAVALAVMSQQYPFAQGWLTAKVLGLVAYIVLGSVALRRGRTPGVRAAAYAAALVTAAYIVSVALSRDPSGFFAWLF